ncbi:glycosyltransferase family 4 protein [candidate division WWE3 bacterium]|uniref:Glycosyltransferase family 4 protein n=1 Tax=candidate division WWE3 bacterium TaxID=2053526 RepID=A0A7X9DK56_UNCKA|nr:glycosyltransferase family 4 protein [candidate division WWE3 bacterium]
MQIAVFTKSTTYHKGHGGLETQNKLLCEGLAARGHRIVVFSPTRDQPLQNVTENGVDYIFVKSSYRYFLSSFNKNSWYNQSYKVFEKANSDSKFDLILGQSSAAIGIIARKELHSIPVVSVSHGTTLGELKTQITNIRNVKDALKVLKDGQYVLRQYFGRQRDFILKSTHVVAVSTAVKKNLVDETFIPEENITVINNGINPTPFIKVREGRNLRGKGVLFVGQLTKDKGIDLLLKMFGSDDFKDISLYIVGDGPLKEFINEQISHMPNGFKIKLLGKIPYQDVVNYYLNEEISVFAFPTKREEGLPMVLVEAMFAGLPVVAFDKGGVTDIVKNSETGYVLKPNDDIGFKHKLVNLVNDPEILSKFSSNALKNAYSSLSLDAMIEKYEDVFKKVMKK